MLFYSIIPKPPLIQTSFNRIARFGTLIGLFIGIFQSFIWLILIQIGWPSEACALCAIAGGAWITGGLHLDGLMDTADALGAGKEKRILAMKDSTIGASGIIAILIIILLQIASTIKLEIFTPLALIYSNFWGRFSPLIAINNFNYIHEKGSGSIHKKNWKGLKIEILPSLILFIILLILIFVFTINNAMKIYSCLFIGIIPAILIPQIIGQKLGGHSGDSYGASVVITETIVLLISALILG